MVTKLVFMLKYLVLTNLLMVIAIPSVGNVITGQAKEASSWDAVAGHDLSSVVWSPNGDYIAFVATPKYVEKSGETEVPYADIWLLRMPVEDDEVSLRRLIHFDRAKGIPSALFWTSSDQLGWASSSVGEKGFAFYTTKINKVEPGPLIDTRLILSYAESAHAPNDVYWDPKSHTLWFNGTMFADYPHDMRTAVICSYQTKTNTLSFLMIGDETEVTLCSWTSDQPATEEIDEETARYTLYYTAMSSARFQVDQAIFRVETWQESGSKQRIRAPEGHVEYPRISPDGNTLAWLEWTGESPKQMVSALMLYDLKSKKNRTLVKLPIIVQYDDPKPGCPFSWSPDGKMIAYADKQRIRTVKVAPNVISDKE